MKCLSIEALRIFRMFVCSTGTPLHAYGIQSRLAIDRSVAGEVLRKLCADGHVEQQTEGRRSMYTITVSGLAYCRGVLEQVQI